VPFPESDPTTMDSITLVGLVAATLTTAAFIPQVIKIWKSRHTKDISLIMYLTFCTGVGLWLLYGVLRNDLPMILANSITFVLALVILILKLKYK